MLSISSFLNSFAKSSEFDAGNVFIFQIKLLGRNIKGALEGLRKFLATDSPSNMLKNAVYFTLKALFRDI